MDKPLSSFEQDHICEFKPYGLHILRCGKCGLGKTVGRNDGKRTICYEIANDKERKKKSEYFTRLFRMCVRGLPGRIALDVGCGEGLFVNVMQKNGWTAHGIDSYRSSISNSAKIQTGDFDLAPLDDKYDLISFIHSFEHMTNPARTLCKARKLLNKKGSLLIVVPNFGGAWSEVTGVNWPWLDLGGHHYHFTQPAIRSLLEKNGFRVKSVRTDSKFTPSIMQTWLQSTGIFSITWTIFRPVRSLVFRLSGAAGGLSNLLVDKVGRGAELQVLAEMKE